MVCLYDLNLSNQYHLCITVLQPQFPEILIKFKIMHLCKYVNNIYFFFLQVAWIIWILFHGLVLHVSTLSLRPCTFILALEWYLWWSFPLYSYPCNVCGAGRWSGTRGWPHEGSRDPMISTGASVIATSSYGPLIIIYMCTYTCDAHKGPSSSIGRSNELRAFRVPSFDSLP